MITNPIDTPIKNLGGRKEKWSPALANKVIEFITQGLNFQQAAQAVGVCPNTLRVWRRDKKGFNERVESAREILRAKVLAEIKAAGATDWRAAAEFLRLSFAEYRFGSGTSVQVALQQTLTLSDRDPERAALIERREKALAATTATKQLVDASERRAEALETERELKDAGGEVRDPEPAHLREHPPTVVDHANMREEMRGWRDAARRDEIDSQITDEPNT
jgi:transposase-like protein